MIKAVSKSECKYKKKFYLNAFNFMKGIVSSTCEYKDCDKKKETITMIRIEVFDNGNIAGFDDHGKLLVLDSLVKLVVDDFNKLYPDISLKSGEAEIEIGENVLVVYMVDGEVTWAVKH